MNRRIILICLGVVLIVILAFVGFSSKHKGANPVSTEVESPGTVIIDNTGELNKDLLPDQFQAVSDALVGYIQTHIDKNAVHATLIGRPEIASDNTIWFSIKVDGQKDAFKVHLDRSTYFDKVIFMVPDAKFSQTLQVY